jgi:hypothetical protein
LTAPFNTEKSARGAIASRRLRGPDFVLPIPPDGEIL